MAKERRRNMNKLLTITCLCFLVACGCTPPPCAETYVSETFLEGFDNPEALAFDAQGVLYVSNESIGTECKGTISRVEIREREDGTHAIARTLYASDLCRPGGLAFDSMGNLWVAEYGASRLTRIAPDGERTAYPGVRSANGVAVDGEDNIYVTEWVGPGEGEFDFCAVWGEDPGMLNSWISDTRASAGCDARVIRVSPEGRREVWLEGLCFPNGIAIDLERQIVYVGETYRSQVRVYEIVGGRARELPHSPVGHVPLPDGISLSSSGDLYVVSPVLDAVQKVDPAGGVCMVVPPGKRGFTTGIAVLERPDGGEELFVSSLCTGKVSRVRLGIP